MRREEAVQVTDYIYSCLLLSFKSSEYQRITDPHLRWHMLPHDIKPHAMLQWKTGIRYTLLPAVQQNPEWDAVLAWRLERILRILPLFDDAPGYGCQYCVS